MASSRLKSRDVRYQVLDRFLVRTVTFPDGRTYTHRCPLKSYEQVAHAVAETPVDGDGTTLELLSEAEDLAFTQVNVALEFLKERGLVDVRHRRCYPGSSDVYLDAMVEFHALRELPRQEASEQT
jgi:hypothetical protein